jgi:hypothetical protein
MDFKTKAHQDAYEKAKAYMQELFGQMAQPMKEGPAFAFQVGSTLTHIAVHPWGDDDATILVRAYVVFGPDLTFDCLKFLLLQNNEVRFGAFGIDTDGDIFFEHSIVGSTLDKEELRASVLAVTTTSDRYDEQIVERWGGMRAVDRAGL